MKLSLKRNNFFVLVAAVIILLVLTNVFQEETRCFFYRFSTPIQQSLWQAGNNSSDFLEGLVNIASLDNKIDQLEQINQGLVAEIIRLEEIEEENKTLRKALDIELDNDYKLSVAKIIAKDIAEDIIIINKGSKDNISENMTLITDNKVLVGIVKEVYGNYSKIMLSSHKDITFDVKIKQEDKEISAVAKGQGNMRIILTLIPKEQVSQGDIITTSSLGGVFQESLLVGKIKEVKGNDIDPFQTAQIENALNISELNNVFIIHD